MTKKHKAFGISAIIAALLLILGFYVINKPGQQQHKTAIATPTLFVHGWGSSYRAEESMTNYAKQHNFTNSIIRADVSPAGKVSLWGTIKNGAKNPIIEVNLLNNKSISTGETNQAVAFKKSSNYIKNVITALQAKYQFKQVNLVGHSMGNLQIAYYLLNNADNPHMPRLNKQVSIAGHYNGFLGQQNAPRKIVLEPNGKPTQMDTGYRGLLGLRKKFPTNAAVLNIYGDTGKGNDGSVAVNSARSYRYLVEKRASSYQEKEITGPQAQHSKLHENTKVDRLLVNFLW